ncbi:MAG: GGDEF domain-containing protein [Nitrospira sp.]|nr:GGDEF domain-containing protein [Nitrospira sp.]
MATSTFKRSWQWLAPGGLVLLLAIGFLRPHGLPAWAQGPISAFPVIVLGFGIVFGWYLSSSRLILSLLVLVCLDRGIFWFPPTDASPGAPGPVLFAVATFLTPVNLLALSLVKEGSVSSWRGLVSLRLILCQPLLVLWLCLSGETNLTGLLTTPFQLPLLPLSTSEWTPLSQPAMLAFASALLLLTVKFLLYHDPLDGGAGWAILTTLLAAHGIQYGWNPTNFFAAAGLTLFLSLVHASHQRTYRDDLTGALGRLAYDEAAARLGGKYVVAIVGVDQLTQYRNQYGKTVSEQVLRLVAPKIMAAAGSGKVFRLTGDEFTVVFYSRTAMDTLAALEQIRKAVAQTTLRLHKQTRVWEGSRSSRSGSADIELPVTLSIGVAEPTAPHLSHTVVTKAAYRALYEAKGEGGNMLRRGTIQMTSAHTAPSQTGRIVAYSEFEP